MALERLYGLTRKQIELVRETVLHYLHLHGGGNERGKGRVVENRTRRATINEDLTAPTSPLAAMTSADLYFINLLDDGTSELDDSGPYTVYNDDPDFTCQRGTLLRVEWLGGRWMIYWAACTPNDALITALDAL